jgi:dihydrodipicolinate synthase/N-acetylneuraminate lyase
VSTPTPTKPEPRTAPAAVAPPRPRPASPRTAPGRPRFRAGGAARTIDVDAYLSHVDWLAGKGVTEVVAFGTNGEGPSVAAGEKLEVLRALFAACPGVQVVPTVAEATLPDTLEMLAALEDLPAAAVMVLPPYFFKPVTPAGLLDFYGPVVRATRHPVLV